MKHSRFKYFPDVTFAEMFMDGKVRCRTAAYFRDYEDAQANQVVGDEYEGARLYRPVTGLEINNQTQKQNLTLNMGMECLTRAHELYLFCLSDSFNDILKREFQAKACVEILNPRTFISRFFDVIPEATKGEGQYIARKVGYYLPEDVPDNVWALPHLIVTTKLKRFAYQDEYRLVYTTTDALAFQNCTYQLADRKARPEPKPEEHLHQDLELGSLHDICKIHIL